MHRCLRANRASNPLTRQARSLIAVPTSSLKAGSSWSVRSQHRQLRWSLHGAQRAQPVATDGKCASPETGSDTRKPLPWAAIRCRRDSMVRVHSLKKGRGSFSWLRRNAKSCEPEGPQDLTSATLTETAGSSSEHGGRPLSEAGAGPLKGGRRFTALSNRRRRGCWCRSRTRRQARPGTAPQRRHRLASRLAQRERERSLVRRTRADRARPRSQTYG
jgi:hypothetical protein